MRYMVDAMLYGLAKELRELGVECETASKLIRGDEDSRVSIPDPDILEYLMKMKGEVCLITLDNELAKYCKKFNVPCIRIQDLVISYVMDARISTH
ncbi:MAG: Mut7-C RNAse domain-containing protein [Nitrososphaerales archaeon]